MISVGLESMTLLLAFDFDGTLAPIVAVPEQARMSLEVARQLRLLADLAPVYVISGRARADLSRRVALPLEFLVGNHGIEAADTSVRDLVLAEGVVLDWKHQLIYVGLEPYLKLECGVEDKKYSLSLHLKRAPQELGLEILNSLVQLVPSPRLVFGHQVINLLPQSSPHKGDALMRLLSHSRATRVIYVGDDDTDEDIFALKDPRLISIRVGWREGSKARYYLRNQDDIRHFLGLLLDLLGNPA